MDFWEITMDKWEITIDCVTFSKKKSDGNQETILLATILSLFGGFSHPAVFMLVRDRSPK